MGADQVSRKVVGGVDRLAVVDIDPGSERLDPRNDGIAPPFLKQGVADRACVCAQHRRIGSGDDLEGEHPMQDVDVVGQEDGRRFGVNHGVRDIVGHLGRRSVASKAAMSASAQKPGIGRTVSPFAYSRRRATPAGSNISIASNT